MDIRQRKLLAYCEAHTTPPDQILYELERETHLKTLAPQMASGHLQGTLLRFISQLQRPTSILEIGTFTGYATLCLAQGLADDGIFHTIEANPEMEYLIRKYLKKAGLEDRVHLHIGKAEEVVPTLSQTFDLVFIDAGKQQYAEHYDLIIDQGKSRRTYPRRQCAVEW
jgi:caffeoyl-CoA O-methyltransferase